MAVAAKIGMLVSGGWGADLRRVLAPLVFLALVTCHTSRLCGQRFNHIPVAMVPVTSALTSGRFALTLASHPAHVVPAFATVGCTNGGPRAITATAGRRDRHTLISAPATPSQALTSRLCSGGAAGANLWLACLLNAPANAARQQLAQTSRFSKSVPMGLRPAKPHQKQSRAAQTCRSVACLRPFERAHTSRQRTAGRMRHPWFFDPEAFLVVWKDRGVSEAETPRNRLAHRATWGWPRNDPSPVSLPLMKPRARDTLCPRERAVRDDC